MKGDADVEKRLRRARTAAIVLAVTFYILSKLGCMWTGVGSTPPIDWSGVFMPTIAGIAAAISQLFDYSASSGHIERVVLMVSCLGISALSATVAYAIHALLRVDAD